MPYNPEPEDPGFCLINLENCLPWEQKCAISKFESAVEGALMFAKATGQEGSGPFNLIKMIQENYFAKSRESLDHGWAFGFEAAKVVYHGQDWAEIIASTEGHSLSRNDHLIETARELGRSKYPISAIMMGLEAVAQFHSHHQRTGALLIDASRSLQSVLPGYEFDEHTISCTFDESESDTFYPDSIYDLELKPDSAAYLALLGWYLMRLRTAADLAKIPLSPAKIPAQVMAVFEFKEFAGQKDAVLSRSSSSLAPLPEIGKWFSRDFELEDGLDPAVVDFTMQTTTSIRDHLINTRHQ